MKNLNNTIKTISNQRKRLSTTNYRSSILVKVYDVALMNLDETEMDEILFNDLVSRADEYDFNYNSNTGKKLVEVVCNHFNIENKFTGKEFGKEARFELMMRKYM